MILGADFSVMKPDFGLLFWTLIAFVIFWIIMARFAFKPIAKALKQREDDIQGALDSAEKARNEMANLKAQNEEILKEAREERTKILREAKEAAESYQAEQKDKADKEFRVRVESALEEIENRKREAMTDLQNQSGKLAVEIAEKILKKDLADDASQQTYVKGLIDDIKLN